MKYLLIGFVLFSLSCYSQDGREIIKRYLDTVSNGDVRNWDKIKSVYTEYQSFYSQQAFEQRVDFGNVDKPSFCKSYRVGLEKNRIDSYGDSTFTKWLSTFYFLEDKTVILIGNIPPMIKKSRPPGEFSSQHPPVFISRLVKKSSAVELLGVKEFLNEALLCYEVKITAKGRNYYYYIDVETFLLRYSITLINKKLGINVDIEFNLALAGPMEHEAVLYASVKHRHQEISDLLVIIELSHA